MRTPKVEGHKVRWYVWAWNGSGASVKMPHAANMRGTWGWDAECSCGWGSHTGGATKTSVSREVLDHKVDVANQDAIRAWIVGMNV